MGCFHEAHPQVPQEHGARCDSGPARQALRSKEARPASAGPWRVQQLMFRFVSRVMDRAFARMSPERRQVVLTHCHETLSVLEHKYRAGRAARRGWADGASGRIGGSYASVRRGCALRRTCRGWACCACRQRSGDLPAYLVSARLNENIRTGTLRRPHRDCDSETRRRLWLVCSCGGEWRDPVSFMPALWGWGPHLAGRAAECGRRRPRHRVPPMRLDPRLAPRLRTPRGVAWRPRAVA